MNNGVSIIISARNEFPQITLTVNSIMLDLWQSGIDAWEIIIADNGSTDRTTDFWNYALNRADARGNYLQLTNEFKVSRRGLVTDGRLRFAYDPVFSNVGARHNAVKYARYENIVFADAHMSIKPNTFSYVLNTLNKFGGVVHVPVAWVGASVYRPQAGYQYSYKIGEKIWGTWNYAVVNREKAFYIPVSGHCFIAVKKQEYLALRGYDNNQRVYGGGENYLDTLYWMMGSTVMCDPRGMVFHLSAGRGYSYDTSSLIHNMILTAYTLGGHKWAERIYVTYLDKIGTDTDALKELYDSAIEEGQPRRDFIDKNKKYSIEEVLALDSVHDCDGSCRGEKYKGNTHSRRIWDKKNDELHGNHLSFVSVFDDWLTRLKTDRAKEFYANSSHQK